MSSNGGVSYEEARAKLRVEPYLGRLERMDVPGTSGLPDFSVEDGAAGGGAVEVTSWVDEDRARQGTALAKQDEWRVPTEMAWAVSLYRRARVRDVVGDPALEALLVELERAGERRLSMGNADDAAAALLERLHIESIFGFPARPGRSGVARATWGSAAGWGWDGPLVAEWIAETLLMSSAVLGKVAKLVRSGRRPAVLYVELDGRLREGFGVSLALESSASPGGDPLRLPRIELPEGLDELWLWPDIPGPGLRITAGGSFEVVQETPEASAQLWPRSTGWVESTDPTV